MKRISEFKTEGGKISKEELLESVKEDIVIYQHKIEQTADDMVKEAVRTIIVYLKYKYELK